MWEKNHNNFLINQVLTQRLKLFWVAALLWLAAMVLIADRTGSVIVDGFQSIGAISASKYSGDLHWPMMGNFMGYDHTWGFHWIGWPLLRSLFLPLLPWNPVTEFSLLCAIWLAVAVLLAKTIKRSREGSSAFSAASLSLLAPGFLVALQSYRPEIITGLLLILYPYARDERNGGKGFFLGMLFLFLPLFHPLGVVIPAAWITADFIWKLRDSGWKQAIFGAIRPSCCLAAGCLLMACWFFLQPQAWDQFLLNIRTQRLLTEGLGPGYWQVMRWGYGSKSAFPLVLLLLGGICGGIIALWHQWQHHRNEAMLRPQTLAAVGFLSASAFNLVAKNPNSNHMLAVMPFAAWLFLLACNSVYKDQWLRLRKALFALFVCVCNVYPLKNMHLLLKQGGKSYRGELRKALGEIPSTGKVLIPVVFWESAQILALQQKTIYQFSTFPNVLERSKRYSYEDRVLSDIRQGDLLLWDSLQEQGGVFNFVEVTALKHQIIRPPSQPEMWEKVKDIHITTRYSKSQPVDFELYRKK
jgi:hypothetical protein